MIRAHTHTKSSWQITSRDTIGQSVSADICFAQLAQAGNTPDNNKRIENSHNRSNKATTTARIPCAGIIERKTGTTLSEDLSLPQRTINSSRNGSPALRKSDKDSMKSVRESMNFK